MEETMANILDLIGEYHINQDYHTIDSVMFDMSNYFP